MVLRQGLVLAGFGIAIGAAAALAATRLLASLLFGISPSDPLTFASVVGLLIAVALSACYVPARNAMKVDPMDGGKTWETNWIWTLSRLRNGSDKRSGADVCRLSGRRRA
jgi:hypothetical protein